MLLFMEIHENPDLAPSDGVNRILLAQLEVVLKQIPCICTGLKLLREFIAMMTIISELASELSQV